MKKKINNLSQKNAGESLFYEAKERHWNMEKAKLEVFLKDQEKILYEPTLKVKQNEEKTEIILKEKTNLEDTLEKYRKKIENCKLMIHKLQFELGNVKDLLSEKEKNAKEFDNLLMEEQSKVKKYFDENLSLKVELEAEKNKNSELNENYSIQTEGLNDLKKKFDAINSELSQANLELIGPDKDTSQTDLEIMVPLSDPVFDKLKATAGSLFRPKHNLLSRSFSRESNQANLLNFKYIRPTFAQILDAPDLERAKYSPPFKNWVNVVIRGIYDSKFFEHLICASSPLRAPSRFLDFVLAWLGQFTIDENSRVVKELEWWKRDATDEIKFQFLLGISQENSKKLWEINTFKEFLNEDLMLDELGFFLHCRYLLFRGPELNYPQAKTAVAHFVQYSRVLEIIEKVMTEIPKENLEDLVAILYDKSKTKGGIRILECSLVLRIMLEYYKNEKQMKYRSVVELFEKSPAQEDSYISFNIFQSICKNISANISDYTIIKLYRDCWSISNGKITADTFFLVANESSLLYDLLSIKGDWSCPPLTSNHEIDTKSGKYAERMNKIYQLHVADEENIELIKHTIHSMGISELSYKYRKLESLILHKYEVPIEEYWIWNLEDIHNRLWSLVIQSQHAFLEFHAHDIRYLGYKHIIEAKENERHKDISEICNKFIEIIRHMQSKKPSGHKSSAANINIRKTAIRFVGIFSTVAKCIIKLKRLKKNKN
ncbi:unnamed protein product [Blepharisma stoltei]|uniref:Uncharacterized protein n=1 Tax=Blepharisma stoltei TaxID=1481888 RepID=A0AAU9J9Q8_9CILI|nr:unnamed protein product [Blepharisma stoltei]